MNWHSRYLQQAAWTHELRNYLFEQAGLKRARTVLEVGCGTGAVLGSLESPARSHGLDINYQALNQCMIHAPQARLTCGDGHHLPYASRTFEIVYCHFTLLWVKSPLKVISEMGRVGRTVLALAEPDYSQRLDEPAALKPLGDLQIDSLRRQGADPCLGGNLASLFHKAGIKLIETGPIQGHFGGQSAGEWEREWEVIEADLSSILTKEEIRNFRTLDAEARRRGERVLNVPTYFAWGES